MDTFDRFKELFEWSFNAGTLRKLRFQFLDYSNTNVADIKCFQTRAIIERIWTCYLMAYRESSEKKILFDRISTLREDIDEQKDYHTVEGEPTSHKIRVVGKKAGKKESCSDAICLRETWPPHKIGRDYQGLVGHTTTYTDTAIYDPWLGRFTKIHRVKSKEFTELVLELEKDWNHSPFTKNTWTHPNGSQVKRFQKECSKHVYFVPFDLFKTHELKEISPQSGEALNLLHRQAWDYVIDRYVRLKET